MKTFLMLLAISLASCSTLVNRASIASSSAPETTRNQALQLLDDAVADANRFLASEYNLSLPTARYETDLKSNLVFVTPDKRWPIRIRNSFAGDLVVWSGFRAQERDDGFVVGSRTPDEFKSIDHSMFRLSDGAWQSVESVARLILHETAHTINGEGTVGYWNTVKYYAEVLFLWRTHNHSDERIPKAVGFEYFFGNLIEEARANGNEDLEAAYRGSFEKHRVKLDQGSQ